MILQAGILVGVALAGLARQVVPPGGLTIMFGLTALSICLMTDEYRFIPGAVLTGLAGDLLVAWMRPSAERPNALRVWALCVPVLLYSLYLLTLAVTEGVWWTVPLWTGAPILAGVAGLLLTYLVLPRVSALDPRSG